MSHVFISYTRADKPYLEKLITWLKDHNFADSDLWYDHHIESGNNWREEIATALDEAFAVIVIVSTNSVKSLYCTYEWAYALGQGIPILPLVFEDVSFTDVPAPLAAKQFVPCVESIPNTLEEQVQRLKSVPPQIAAINASIYNAIYDIHRVYFMLDWLEDELLVALGDNTPNEIMESFVADASVAQKKLENLMIEKALIFTTKQHRLCWKFVDLLKILAQTVGPYDVFDNIPFFTMDNEWLSTIEYFNELKYWNKQMRFYFEQNLEGNKRLLVEIARIFPALEANQIDILLHNCDVRRKERIMAQIKSDA